MFLRLNVCLGATCRCRSSSPASPLRPKAAASRMHPPLHGGVSCRCPRNSQPKRCRLRQPCGTISIPQMKTEAVPVSSTISLLMPMS
jgi:hypothetical protein